MSTLKVTNIQATGETASRAVSGVAAALLFYGSQAIIGSRNISSVTDIGTGQLTISFSNHFADDDWVGHHTTEDEQPYINTNRTASGVTLVNKTRTDATSDCSDGNATIHGDLA